MQENDEASVAACLLARQELLRKRQLLLGDAK
jgi:hypothetical protein